MLRQTDKHLDKYIQKYGCYFMSLIYYTGKNPSASEINNMWKKCLDLGYISGDLNRDGDLDDANEAIIVNPNGVCSVIGLKASYIDKHFPSSTDTPAGFIAVGCFYNPTTRFKHFVAIDKNKKVLFDPIENSNTVRNGLLHSIRLYRLL